MQEHIDAVYELFLEKAADGRGSTRDSIHEVAQGRVWTGRQAKALGLIDELGGLSAAVALAKEQAGLEVEDEVDLVIYPKPRNFIDLVSESFVGRQGVTGFSGGRVFSNNLRVLRRMAVPLELFRRGEPLALMPAVLAP